MTNAPPRLRVGGNEASREGEAVALTVVEAWEDEG